jgi:hypothetical protein
MTMIVTASLALLLGAMPQESCVPAPAAGHAGARSLPWYISGETATVAGKKYAKYGLPRVLQKGDVEKPVVYKGGHFFSETGATQREVLYLLTDLANCEFQPYQVEG